ELPIAIGGRDRAKAEAVATEIGHAVATTIDLERPDLGLRDEDHYAAVAIFVKDETLNALRYSLDRKLPFVSISTGTYEI
ncbi:NAD(P)-dependent oxidoreductase, partial [Rhizobiaceae sp. 2RAB30]